MKSPKTHKYERSLFWASCGFPIKAGTKDVAQASAAIGRWLFGVILMRDGWMPVICIEARKMWATEDGVPLPYFRFRLFPSGRFFGVREVVL